MRKLSCISTQKSLSAYLDKEKTHKILYMSPLSGVYFYVGDNLKGNFDIEAVNVEKIFN